MARPAKNNCDYFPHDAGMRNHRKVKAIRSRFGVMGYAVWSMVLEYLTGNDGNVFEYSDLEFELMSGDFGVSATEIRDVVDYCISLELLFNKNGFINSDSLDERLAPVYTKRGQAKELSAKQRRINGKFAINNTESNGVSVTEMPQSKVNRIKVNGSTVNDIVAAGKPATPEERKKVFYDSLKPFVDKYTKEMLREFYEYWTEISPKGKKLRFEKETVFDPARRLSTWKNNEKNKFNGTKISTTGTIRTTDAIIEPGKDFGIAAGF